MPRVLVAEDDPRLVRALVIDLRTRHYGVDAAPTGPRPCGSPPRSTPAPTAASPGPAAVGPCC